MGIKGEQARELFMQGHNCSQSVAAVFSKEMGLSQDLVMRMSSGFGAGFGRLREVCGAFSGAVLVLGTLYGSQDPAKKTEIYKVVQEMAEESRRENGSIVCKELLGLAKPEGSPVASPRTSEYYKKRPCAELVEMAADQVQAYIEAHPLNEQNP